MARTCRAVTGDLVGPNHSVCGRYKKVQQKEIGGPETAMRQQASKENPLSNLVKGLRPRYRMPAGLLFADQSIRGVLAACG